MPHGERRVLEATGGTNARPRSTPQLEISDIMKTTQMPATLPAVNWQPETLAALEHLRAICPGTVALRDAEAGFRMGEPLLILADQCIRYAKAYRNEFEQPIGEDYVARPEFSGLLSGFRGLLNFDGAAKWEADHKSSTHRGADTKDNGLIEALYWTACEIAGIDGNAI